ncbi:MAG TPA: MerR family transcriptional regulator [Dehalococcoidia bacterium]|nr:MerR family transcriptional regulator [Dehalococcoidia bacterium]
MSKKLGIGTAARLSGLSTKAIRFYERANLMPPASRTESGYRVYTARDVRRLRFIRRMRLLGVPLEQIRPLVLEGMAADCGEFAGELGLAFERRRAEINRRIADLEALRDDLDDLARHVSHCECEPGQAVLDCGFCLILDEEGGESNGEA